MAHGFSLCLTFLVPPLCTHCLVWTGCVICCKTGRVDVDRRGLLCFPYDALSPKPFQNLTGFCASYQFIVSQLQIHLEGTLLLSSSCNIRKQGGCQVNLFWVWKNTRMQGSTWQPHRPDPGRWSNTMLGAPSILPALGLFTPSACPRPQSPAAASLNPWGWLPACLVTKDQLGQTSTLLCHPVGCSYCIFNKVWTQIWGPLFQVCPSPQGYHIKFSSILSLLS